MNKKILLYCLLLNIIGLIMVYSSSSIWAKYKFNDSFRYLKFQGIFMLVGLIIIKIISKIDMNFMFNNARTRFRNRYNNNCHNNSNALCKWR